MPEIIGTEVPGDQEASARNLEHAQELAAYFLRVGVERVKEEVEATPEELEMIRIAIQGVREKYEELGIPAPTEVSIAQFHIIPKEGLINGDPNIVGIQRPPTRSITLRRSPNKTVFLMTLVHETWHQFQRSLLQYSPLNKRLTHFKTGYRTKGRSDGENRFLGLNEAVTDKLTYEVLQRKREEIMNTFGLTIEDFIKVSGVPGYPMQQDLLEIIIEKVAAHKGIDKTAVWDQIAIGNLTGNPFYLRDIEKTFGKGSLRVLSTLTSWGNISDRDATASKIYREVKIFSSTLAKAVPGIMRRSGFYMTPREVDYSIVRYFQTDDIKEREEIARKILMPKEREAFNLRRNRS